MASDPTDSADRDSSHPPGSAPPARKRPDDLARGAEWDVCGNNGGERPDGPPDRSERDVCTPSRAGGGRKREGGGGNGRGWPHRRVGELAEHQRGLVTRTQLFELGLSRAVVDYALQAGRIRSIHRGVYAVGHLSLPELACELAAVLAVGAGARVSHLSAAAMWRFGLAASGDVQVTIVGRDAGRRRPGIEVHRTAFLHRADIATLHGIPITSAARTLLDITPELSDRALERAFDTGLKARAFTRHAVARTAARAGTRPGATRLAALAAAELGPIADARSRAAQRFLELVRASGLPLPEAEVPIGRYVVDFLWRSRRLAVEIDGFRFHATRRSFHHDRDRDLWLRGVGLQVVHFSAEQVLDQPERVLVAIARDLAAADARDAARDADRQSR